MATAGMTASYRSGEQRRGPPPRTARGNNYNQSRSQPGGMPKRNGAPNYSPISSQPNSPNVGSDDSGDDGFYTNSRMLSGVTQCVGKLVKVDVINGGTYEGILMTISKDFSLYLDQAKLMNRPEGGCDSQVTNAFLIKKEDYISFRAVSVDVRADTFVDGAISGAGRVNGQNADPTKVKTLVQWNDDSDETGTCLEDTSGSNGWDATEMFSTNASKFNVETSYRDSMECYTTPLPKFKSAEEEQRARRFAEENARMIESSDGYNKRLDAENNPSVDEETKYSSVVRDPEPKQNQSTPDRYVIPNLRRGPGGGPPPPTAPSQHAPSQQPLPPRERRERGDVRQSEGRGEQQPGRRWESNPGPRGPNQHPMPTQPPHIAPHSAPPPQHRESQDRINGDSRDRRQDMSGRSGGGYNTNRPPPHHMGPPQQQGAPSQRGPPQPLPHMAQHHPAQGPPAQVMQHPPPGVHRHPPPPVAATPTNMPPPPNAGSPHSAEKAPPVMSSQQAPTPQEAAVLVADKKSPREKDRHAKQVANLQQFHSNFNIKLEEEKKDERGSDQSGERRGEHHYDGEQQAPSQDLQGPASSSSSHPPPAPSQAPMGAHGVGTATSQGATASLPLQGPPATQAPAPSQSPNSGAKSMLNPNAMEFKPRGVQVATTPTPSATPPAPALRQSPGMLQAHPHQHQHQHHGQSMLVQPSYYPVLHQKMMPLQTSSHQQQQSKPYAPKRAVVSVDPTQVALAAQNATGQPLTLAAQAATLNQPSYVYQLPPGQMLQQGNPQGYPMQMRVVQSHMPQGAGMDPNQGATNQQQHIQQQLFMTQQPVPAHMQAGGMTQTMAQPAHTHALHHHSQHLPHNHPHTQLPPASQPQVAHNHPHPHPSPSPVQTHPHGGPQGVQPPQSGTPQPMGYQHAGMAAMMPPQGHSAQHSAMPAHSQAQPAHNPTLHFMQQQHQMQFSQAGGGSNSGGPAPAHMQAGGHLNQPQHVVVMPQPPPQAINQAGPLNPLNPPHGPHSHHQHQHQHQHAAAAAQFQQQLQQQGQASQMHAAGVGPNQHMLQGGNVSAANAGLAMPHNLFMQPGLQAGHGHQHHAHHHPHPHTQHFQGQ